MLQHVLKQLVSIRSYSNDGTANARLLDLVEKELKPYLMIRRFSSHGHPSLIATTRNTKKPKLLLAAHTDVVPGPDTLFRLRQKGNRLMGRGAVDMKFAIACYVSLVKELRKQMRGYDVGILLTSDEEIGGVDGGEEVLKKGYKTEFGFLAGSGINYPIKSWIKKK